MNSRQYKVFSVLFLDMKGWIALDIDGTITKDKYSVPLETMQYFDQLHKEGWNFAFSTGRVFRFAHFALDAFTFPFVLFLQNGSLALDMPSKTILFKSYIPKEHTPLIVEACKNVQGGLIAYMGYEKQDQALFSQKNLSQEELHFIKEVEKREQGSWQQVDQFDLDFDPPLVKCFGPYQQMLKLASVLRAMQKFQVSLIEDPFLRSYYLLLVTDISASKGLSLKKIFSMKGKGFLSIGGGDDENDISLLQASDVRISMPNAPESVRKIADFIAPPLEEGGIVEALKIVMTHVSNRSKNSD